jgi:hypothetical protein
MSWLFSRALVEEYSEAICLDGEQSALLSGNLTPQAYLSPDKMTGFSRLSRFGMTFKPLTESRGEELLMSYRAGFPARTLALQEKAPELPEREAECGVTWRGSLARFDRVSLSWKTAQHSLLEDSGLSSVIWPRSGMTADGQCWVLPMSALRTSGIDFGLLGKWPTPTVCGNYNRKGASKTSGDGLATAVKKWPTPQASDNRPRATANSTARRIAIGKQVSLEAAVKFWPTPTAHNAKEGAFPAEYTRNTPTLAAQAGGALNPKWVEWLMGWPLGWTDLKPLETGKFLCVPQQPLPCSQANLNR